MRFELAFHYRPYLKFTDDKLVYPSQYDVYPSIRKPQGTEVTMVVQVNGKVRDRIEVDAAIDAPEMERLALGSQRVQEHLRGQPPKKVIPRPPKLVNVVV